MLQLSRPHPAASSCAVHGTRCALTAVHVHTKATVTQVKYAKNYSVFGSFTICYIGKHEGSDFINYDNDSGHGSERDVLVFNVGNHPASKTHRRLRDYTAEVRDLLNLFGTAADSSPQHGGLKAALWLASTPITASDQAFHYFYKDWRSTHRLRLFNDAALNETLRFLGPATGAEGLYAFVDVFPLAMAAIQDAPDFAHLAGLHSALDGVVDQLITEMLAQVEKRKELQR